MEKHRKKPSNKYSIKAKIPFKYENIPKHLSQDTLWKTLYGKTPNEKYQTKNTK